MPLLAESGQRKMIVEGARRRFFALKQIPCRKTEDVVFISDVLEIGQLRIAGIPLENRQVRLMAEKRNSRRRSRCATGSGRHSDCSANLNSAARLKTRYPRRMAMFAS